MVLHGVLALCTFCGSYWSNGDSYIFLQRRQMFIFMQTFGSRNRFAKSKTPCAKKKSKFIFKKIGEIFGDGSGVALALPNKGVSAHQELCLESSETVPDTRQKVRKTSQKSIGNPAKNGQKSGKKMPEIPSKCKKFRQKSAGKSPEKVSKK
jgi:hypothetical protein